MTSQELDQPQTLNVTPSTQLASALIYSPTNSGPIHGKDYSGLYPNKDSRWLTLEICREHVKNKCQRPDHECKYAHPPKCGSNLEIHNGRVVCCYDFIKGKCNRKSPPCKYLHPPAHLKEQLLQNGRNNLIMKNIYSNILRKQIILQQQQHYSPNPSTSFGLQGNSNGHLSSNGVVAHLNNPTLYSLTNTNGVTSHNNNVPLHINVSNIYQNLNNTNSFPISSPSAGLINTCNPTANLLPFIYSPPGGHNNLSILPPPPPVSQHDLQQHHHSNTSQLSNHSNQITIATIANTSCPNALSPLDPYIPAGLFFQPFPSNNHHSNHPNNHQNNHWLGNGNLSFCPATSLLLGHTGANLTQI